MKTIKKYIAEGPVVAASEAASETAVAEDTMTVVAVGSQTAVAVCSDDANRRRTPKRHQLGCPYHSMKRDVIQNWKRRRIKGGGGGID